MTLLIENVNFKRGFIRFLKKRILQYAMLSLSPKRLHTFDEFFNSSAFRPESINVRISSRRVLLIGLSNLEHSRGDTTTSIFISPTIRYPGTDYLIVDLCRLINYGNLSVEPYPIISDTMTHFSKHIRKYQNKFILGLG